MKEKKEKKTAEQRANDHEANNLLNMIIAKTYARHSQMTEAEFMADIGFADSGKTEAEAVRVAKFNVIVELTNQLFRAKNSIKMAHGIMKMCFNDEDIIEKNEKNVERGEK